MTLTDRCPGVLRPHRAEDGLMIRLRLPGGRISTAGLALLGRLASAYGYPALQLTSRAGIQLRGLPDPVPSALVAALVASGLVPDAAHERVRTIVCSPLSGIHGGSDNLRGLVAELDAAILGSEALTELSGRFSFVLDDGRGDVSAAPFDLGYRALAPGHGVLLVGDDRHGWASPRREAAGRLVALAVEFLRRRPDRGAWHVRDLPSGQGLVAPPLGPWPATDVVCPLGAVGNAASVQVPLGMLGPEQLAAVTATGMEVIVTPWRGLVLPGAAHRLDSLRHTGLVTDAGSPWARISACVGAPHCARTSADTFAAANRLVETGVVLSRTHVSGCPRRCGAPAAAFRDVVLSGTTVS